MEAELYEVWINVGLKKHRCIFKAFSGITDEQLLKKLALRYFIEHVCIQNEFELKEVLA